MSTGSGPFRGIIFDLDGVLIDTEPIYMRTMNEVLREAGAPLLTTETNREYIGKPAGYTWESLQARSNLPESSAFYQQRYDDRLEEILRRELALRPEADALLREVAARGVPRAIATSSRRKWVDLKLQVLGLEQYFCAVVTGEDVGRSKPAPDVYLRAAEEASILTSEAFAIEDSPSGIAAAKAAGLYTIALRTTSTEGMDLGEADMIIESLDEFVLDILVRRASEAEAPVCR